MTIKPLYRISIKYGVIGSLLGMLLIIILYYIGRHPLLIPPPFDFRIILFGIFIFFGLREFRTYYNNNELNFWQGMLISFIIYMTIGLLVGIFIIVFATMVPEFLNEYITGTIQGLEMEKERLLTEGEFKITEEQFNNQIAMLKTIKPALLAVDYIIKSCLIGFFIAIILSVVLRRTEKRFE